MSKTNHKKQHKKALHNKKKLNWSTIALFCASLTLISFYCGFKQGQYQKEYFNYTPKTVAASSAQFKPPVRIIVKSINVDLPVIESGIVKGIWQVNNQGASHLTTSGKPGENNNIVIYGHNFKQLFGSLKSIHIGDSIVLTTSDNHQYYYKVITTTSVSPNEITEVMPTRKEVLTLFTCDGFADTKRFVVKAVPVHNL